MTNDHQRRTVDEFVAELSRLRADENGLAPDYGFAELNPIAKLCYEVENLTTDADTPEELLLHRVAILTGDLIAAVILGGGRTIVREWLIARAELLRLRLSAL